MIFVTGSQIFFSDYKDYKPKDIDKIEIVENSNGWSFRQLTVKNQCIFQIKKQDSVSDYIQIAKLEGVGIALGEFLAPEFAKYIGLTVSDLQKLDYLISKLDKLHQYQKIIWESYIENNAFILTDKQRLKAYNEYKKARPEIYNKGV